MLPVTEEFVEGGMKTVKRSKLSNIRMVAGGEKKIKQVILDGTVREWVGIGWIDCGSPTAQQKQMLRHVIED